MAQPKALLAIGGAAVVAAAVVLVIAINKGDKADASGAQPTEVALPSKTAPQARPGVPGAPVIKPGDNAAVDPDRPPPLEYEVEGVKIRDHRKNPKPLEVPPNIHPPESRKIGSAIVGDFHRQARLLTAECAKGLPADKAKGGKVTMQVTVTIRDKQAKVVKGVAAISDVADATDAITATKSCLETKAVGLVAAAPDEADIENYTINLTMPL